MLEALLVMALVALLLTFDIQVYRQRGQVASAERALPWQTLVVFGLWMGAWFGRGMWTARREAGEPANFARASEWLLAASATALIANGVFLTILSRGWWQGAGPDPIRTLFWISALSLLGASGAAASIFFRPIRRGVPYWLLSLLILGAVCFHNLYALAQTIAAV